MTVPLLGAIHLLYMGNNQHWPICQGHDTIRGESALQPAVCLICPMLGEMAQTFHCTFQVGINNKVIDCISTVLGNALG